MNAEELKQLKKGDEIFIRARFVNVLGDGDVMFSHSVTNAYDKVVREESFTHPKNVILFTQAAELEPYALEEEAAYVDDEECGILHIYYNYNGGRDKVRTFYENGPESWNATKAAAAAECARLNAEHRKEKA